METTNKVEAPTNVQAPNMDDLALPATNAAAAPAVNADQGAVPAKEAPIAEGGKVIPKFTRYQMLPDGSIQNRSTEQVMDITEDPKNPGVMQCRLTDDDGKRKYIKTADMFTKLFNPDIEGKTSKADKPEKGLKLSKSMKIYLLAKAGISVNQIVDTPTGDPEDPTFVANHVRSSIKDYNSASNQIKRDKAERIAAELEKAGTPFIIPEKRVEPEPAPKPEKAAPAPAVEGEAVPTPAIDEKAPVADTPSTEAPTA